MIPHWTRYRRDTGAIVATFACDESEATLNSNADYGVLAGQYSWPSHYVRDGAAVPRPAGPAVLDGLLLTQVPVPAILQINQATYPLTEATVELAFTLPGSYVLTLRAFPYLDQTFTVTV